MKLIPYLFLGLVVLSPGCGGADLPPPQLPDPLVKLEVDSAYLVIDRVDGAPFSGFSIQRDAEVAFTGGFDIDPQFQDPMGLTVSVLVDGTISNQAPVPANQVICDSAGKFSYTGTIIAGKTRGDAKLRVTYGSNTLGETTFRIK